MAEVNATLRSARVSGYKARLVANQIRGKQVEEALDILSFDLQKSAPIIKKYWNLQLQTLNIIKV